MVAKAVGDRRTLRTGWDNFDAQASDGTTIEVKCLAFLQSWVQKRIRSFYSDGLAPGSLMEIFFGIITRQAIRRGTFTSVKDLVATIGRFVDGWNERCERFSWVKDADEIITKIQRKRAYGSTGG